MKPLFGITPSTTVQANRDAFLVDANYCREQAAECCAQAAEAIDPEIATRWLDLATRWNSLANAANMSTAAAHGDQRDELRQSRS